jgi:hypothetical protein
MLNGSRPGVGGFDGTSDLISICLKAQVTRDTLMPGLKMDKPFSADRLVTRYRRCRWGRMALTENDVW